MRTRIVSLELKPYFIFYAHENTINQTSSALKRRQYFLSAACTIIIVVTVWLGIYNCISSSNAYFIFFLYYLFTSRPTCFVQSFIIFIFIIYDRFRNKTSQHFFYFTSCAYKWCDPFLFLYTHTLYILLSRVYIIIYI